MRTYAIARYLAPDQKARAVEAAPATIATPQPPA